MPQERRCAFRPIVTQRAALTVHTSLHSHIMEALTTHHLISSRLVKQLTKHSLYPFLKSDPSPPHLPARVSSAFHIHEPMRTDNHRQPWGLQPSSHPAIPRPYPTIYRLCVCVCLLNRTATHPHGTCSCSCSAARRFDARRK
jgi:hypothetical protein